jgi:hypothetical protein
MRGEESSGFESRQVTFRGSVRVAAPVEVAFPLFSPSGERLWVPGWNPEPVCPPHDTWTEGAVFRTREESGSAIWIVTRLDNELHRVTYHRVEPGVLVARVDVVSKPAGEHESETLIDYTFTGLSRRGNDAISAMNESDFERKMERWTEWITHHLESRRTNS